MPLPPAPNLSTTAGGDRSARPAALAPDPDRVPEALRERPQWVGWKYAWRGGKWTKVPINPRTGNAADSTDPSTWGTFEESVAAWRNGEPYAGIGFVFTAGDEFAGIDLDDCIGDGDQLVPAAREIVDQFNSYTEVSPSGKGVKIFIRGVKPDGSGCKSKKIEGFKETEVYDHERYFTVTGRHLAGTPQTVESRQPELDALCRRLWPRKRSPHVNGTAASAGFSGDDEALIARAGAAKNGDRFRALWVGDTSLHAGDDSGADQALCNLLAFWTGKDVSRMDRLFRRSGLYRPKWDERRGLQTYGERTIACAIEGCTETYSPNGRLRPGRDNTGAGHEQGDVHPPGTHPGQRDGETGRLILSPQQTLPTAEAFVRQFHTHPDGRTLVSYAGSFWEWRGNRYVEIEDESLRKRILPWLHRALRWQFNRKLNAFELVDFNANPTTTNAALDTIRAHTHLPVATTTPRWLDDDPTRPPVHELLTCRTMSLHLPTGRIIPASPALFTPNALDFDYVADPEPPHRWIRFLDDLLGDDTESRELLQDWLGYCLTPDTRQQKALLIVGPRRSGKGTIGRILRYMIGHGNVAGPTTGSLAGAFGLQPLIGKSLAIVSDARFRGENVSTIVERLLCIIGEDALTIDRKYLGAVTMKLPTRFVFLTNEMPRFSDSSVALVGRFVVLRLTQSFYGREDLTLTDALLDEMPGILVWAIAGWKRLHARGRFVLPASSEEMIRDLEDLSSPIGAFVRDQCEVGPEQRVFIDDLFAAWKRWCERDGRIAVGTKQDFGRNLSAAVPTVSRRRSTSMMGFYDGIGLKEGAA